MKYYTETQLQQENSTFEYKEIQYTVIASALEAFQYKF